MSPPDVPPGQTFSFDATPAPVPERPAAAEGLALGEEVARGGMGRIVAGRDLALDRPVAVKQLLGESPQLLARFAREARITAQLQHPSIVPVYAVGQDEQGLPYYTMKLVDGISLAEAIDGAEGLAGRLALLSPMISVCEAIAHAHDRSVIHRDLKPANVLVGDLGETLVIDWGLAKRVGEVEAPLAGDPTTTAEGPADLTVAGTLMGTPVFLAPELLDGGDIADTRSDVYALGAMLYNVLAGRPPYEGQTALKVLTQVAMGPPAPLPAELPADLRAIVERAMAREAAERPTARELAAELRRFQTGQLVRSHAYSPGELMLRWTRRNRAALGVAAAATLLLVLGGTWSVVSIVEARDEAVRRRDAAERLVDVVMVDLLDQLAPVDRLGVLDTVASSVDAYYEALGPLAPEEGAMHRATALATLGAVRRGVGQLQASREAHLAAAVAREGLGRGAEAVHSRAEAVRVARELGQLEVALDEARANASRAAQGEGPGWGEARAHAQLELGRSWAALGRLEQARAALGAGLTALDDRADPLAADLSLELARAEWQAGAFEAAAGSVGGLVAVAEAALAASPGAMGWRRRLAAALKLAAHVAIDRGRHDEGMAALIRAEELLEDAVGWDPANARWREDLAAVVSLRAYLLSLTGADPAAERAAQQRTLVLAEELVALDPDDLDARSRVLLARTNLAAHDRDTAPGAARERLNAVLADRDALLAEAPADVHLAGITSRTWDLYAAWCREDGDGEAAVTAWRRALEVLDGVDNREENPTKWHGDRVRFWLPLAELLLELDRADEAAGVLDTALPSLEVFRPEHVRVVDQERLATLARGLAARLDRSLPEGWSAPVAGP